MSGWKSSLLTLALAACFGTLAQAQGIVPGGWAPQFGFQTFPPTPGLGGPYLGNGFNNGFNNGFGYGVPGTGFVTPGLGGYGLYNNPGYGLYFSPSSQATNAIDPLIGAIRRSTSRKGGW